MVKTPYKMFAVDSELHRRVKTAAFMRNIPMTQLLEEMFECYIKHSPKPEEQKKKGKKDA